MNSHLKNKTIVFIHGLFMNPKSWDPWVKYFETKGYKCYAPAYPFHEGEPTELRNKIDPGLGKINLKTVVESISEFISLIPEKPVFIGHSMGGLITQLLMQQEAGYAGVCISTAPPKGIFSFEPSFLKANLATINPLKGDSPCLPTAEWYQYAFCNTMTIEETQIEYDKFVVPESRNIPRSSTGKQGKIDFAKAHDPLLFIAGVEDHIIPNSLVKKNYEAYSDRKSITLFKEFPNRTHFICNQPQWEEVAAYIEKWIDSL